MAQRLVREPKHPHRRTRHRNAPLPGITLRILLVGASRSLLRRGRRIWQRKASCPTVSQCPAGRYRRVLNPPERDRPPRLRQESPLVDHPCTKTHFYSAPQYLVVGIASRNGRKQSPEGARKVSYARFCKWTSEKTGPEDSGLQLERGVHATGAPPVSSSMVVGLGAHRHGLRPLRPGPSYHGDHA